MVPGLSLTARGRWCVVEGPPTKYRRHKTRNQKPETRNHTPTTPDQPPPPSIQRPAPEDSRVERDASAYGRTGTRALQSPSLTHESTEPPMNRTRNLLLAASVVALGATFGVEQSTLNAATKARAVQAPKFVVDPLWPKPLPSHTLLGSANGVAVDSHDHIFVLNNPNSFTARTEIGAATNPPTGNCCEPTSPVLEFDAAGVLVAHWGGPGQGYDWPATPSGIAVDENGNVWIGGSGVADGQILKFSHDGKFLMQAGKPGKATAAAAAPPRGALPSVPGA